MPENFLRSFVQRLDTALEQHVCLAQDNQIVHAGEVLFAPN